MTRVSNSTNKKNNTNNSNKNQSSGSHHQSERSGGFGHNNSSFGRHHESERSGGFGHNNSSFGRHHESGRSGGFGHNNSSFGRHQQSGNSNSSGQQSNPFSSGNQQTGTSSSGQNSNNTASSQNAGSTANPTSSQSTTSSNVTASNQNPAQTTNPTSIQSPTSSNSTASNQNPAQTTNPASSTSATSVTGTTGSSASVSISPGNTGSIGPVAPPVAGTGQLLFSDNLQNLNNWNDGVNIANTGAWSVTGGIKSTNSPSDVSTGPNGLTITSNINSSTGTDNSGAITSKQSFGANGQSFYAQAEVQESQDQSGFWMLNADGGDEIDLLEGNRKDWADPSAPVNDVMSPINVGPNGTNWQGKPTNTGVDLTKSVNTFGVYVNQSNNTETYYFNGKPVETTSGGAVTDGKPWNLILSDGDNSGNGLDNVVQGTQQMHALGVQVYSGPPAS